MEKVVLLGKVERLSYFDESDDDADDDEDEVVAVEAVAGLGSWARIISRTLSFC